MNYLERISKTNEQVTVEQRELNVEQGRNVVQQGKLSIQSQMLSAQSEVKKGENKVAEAKRTLEETKGYIPLNVQTILNARKDVKQSELDLTSKVEEQTELQEAFSFLSTLETELFS